MGNKKHREATRATQSATRRGEGPAREGVARVGRPLRAFRPWQLLIPAAVVGLAGAIVAAPQLAAWRTGVLLDVGELDSAETWLGRAEWLGINRGEATFLRATLASRRGQLVAAARWLRLAAEAGYPPDRVKRAEMVLLAQAGRFAELGDGWADLLAHPGADAAGIYRGFVLYALASGLTADATKVITRWREQFPESADPHRFAGLVATIESNWPAAEQAYRLAHNRQPDDPEILAAVADCLMNQLHFEEALPFWQKLLDAAPNSLAATIGLADCQSKLGDAAAAEQTLSRQLSVITDNADALALLGRVCLEQQKPAEAVAWYKKAQQLRPESTEIRRLLAQAYRLNGQPDAANQLEPQIEEGEQALTEIRKLNGQLTQRPQDAALRYRLGELTWRWKSHTEGLNWMRVVLRVDPQHEAARKFLSEHQGVQHNAAETESFDFPGTASHEHTP